MDLDLTGLDVEEVESLGGAGCHVMLHSPNVMMHFAGAGPGVGASAPGSVPQSAYTGGSGAATAGGISAFQGSGNLDDWGQVQPQVIDPN